MIVWSIIGLIKKNGEKRIFFDLRSDPDSHQNEMDNTALFYYHGPAPVEEQ